MSLVEYAQAVDPVFFVVSIIVVLGLFFTVVLIVFVNIIHLILSPRLDPVLFNERWFTSAELAMFSAWPLSLIKTGIYMALVGFPKRMIKTKRFKGYDLKLSFKMPLIIVSRIYILLVLFNIFLGLSFGIIGLYAVIEAKFF